MAQRLDLAFYHLGYTRAATRFLAGGEQPGRVMERVRLHQRHPETVADPAKDQIPISAVFIALFEACNWSTSLDDRLRREWPPSISPGIDWWQHVPNGGLARGMRYARNAVHHDWAQAITFPGDFDTGRFAVSAWAWDEELRPDRPDPHGEAAYKAHLAGKSAMVTLSHLTAVYAEALARVIASRTA